MVFSWDFDQGYIGWLHSSMQRPRQPHTVFFEYNKVHESVDTNSFFLKKANPGLFLFIFIFSNTLQIFTTYTYVKKMSI